MKVQFLEDTYIRSAPIIAASTILGVAKAGKCIEVEGELVAGQSFRAVSWWYRDVKGHYYWVGATKSCQEVAIDKPNAAVVVKEKMLFDSKSMNRLIQEWSVLERFWWNGIQGEGVNLAILSTGIVTQHLDLVHRIIKGYNFCDPAAHRNIEDQDGEGTAIAGLMAADGQGQVYGLAPGASLFIGKVAEKADDYTFPPLMDALYWALELPVNLLYLGAIFPADSLAVPELAALEQVLNKLKQKGVLVIAPDAFGPNTQFKPSIPAALPNCLAIADLQELDLFHPSSWRGLTALGSYLLTTVLPSWQDPYFHGAKAAGAVTCGLLALIGQSVRQSNPTLSFAEVWGKLQPIGALEDVIAGYLLAERCTLLPEKLGH